MLEQCPKSAPLIQHRLSGSSAEAFKQVSIERDIYAIRTAHTLPKSTNLMYGPGLFQPSPERKLRAATAALGTLPAALPRESWASTYHLWHDDLHMENIFVDPKDPATILSIIDWQSTFVAPLYDRNLIPSYLHYDGPDTKGIEEPPIPRLPSDPSEKAAAIALLDAQMLAVSFKRYLQMKMPAVFDAVMWQESDAFDIVNATRDLLANPESYCLYTLAMWEQSPVEITAVERQEILRDMEDTEKSAHIMQVIKEALGDLFPDKGLVRPEDYEDTKAALRQVKKQVIEDFSQSEADRREWERCWPFDD